MHFGNILKKEKSIVFIENELHSEPYLLKTKTINFFKTITHP